MFHFIMTFGWTLMNAYAFWRIATLSFVTRRSARVAVGVFGVLMWSTTWVHRWFEDRGRMFWSDLFEFVAMNWLGAVFILCTCFLVVDVPTVFGLVFRKRARALRTGAFILWLIVCSVAFTQGMRAPVVRDHEVRLAGLPDTLDGAVLVAVSDMHLGALIGEDWVDARVEQINALEPDMICTLGDIVEGHGDGTREQPMAEAMRGLHAPLGVWGVTGNHEHHGDMDSGVRFHQEAGIRLLRNEWREVAPGLVVAGVDRGMGVDWDRVVTTSLKDRPDAATILLSHRPLDAETAAAEGVGLMLSGHTHGGQIWPFNMVVARRNPYVAGGYDVGDMRLIVCRGTGTWGPRMRLWRASEILRITLRAE
ncbi:MAG: metallophosphoesterase [Desulfatibacillaceae bacterium]